MATKKKTEPTSVVAFKGFNPDFTCHGYKFEVGKTYEHDGKVEACSSGFHACENPFDVLSYYPLVHDDGSLGKFARVTLSGKIDRHADGSKIAGGTIAIEAELRLPEFIKAGISWLIEATKGKSDLSDNGGDSAQIGSSGYYAQIGSSGDSAQIGSSGYYAQIGSSGNSAQIGSSGNSAQIGSSGDSAQIKSEGERAVIACAGIGATVSGKDGAWLSLAEYEYTDGRYVCVGFATGCIGKDGLKPDAQYRAQGGKLVEVK